MKKLMVALALTALSFGAAATGNSNNNTVPVNVSGDIVTGKQIGRAHV